MKYTVYTYYLLFCFITACLSSQAQTFKLAKDHFEINGRSFPICHDSVDSLCNNSFMLSTFDGLLGHSKQKLKKQHINGKVTWTNNFIYDKIGVTITTKGSDKNYFKKPVVTAMEFEFFKTDTMAIAQNISIMGIHIDNTLTYYGIINDSVWGKYVSDYSTIYGDERQYYDVEFINFKQIGPYIVVMNFKKIKNEFFISKCDIYGF